MLRVQSKLVFKYLVPRDLTAKIVLSVSRLGSVASSASGVLLSTAVHSFLDVRYHPPPQARAHGDVPIRCRHLAGRTPNHCVFTDIHAGCHANILVLYKADRVEIYQAPVFVSQAQTCGINAERTIGRGRQVDF